jgi:hypothetical protein
MANDEEPGPILNYKPDPSVHDLIAENGPTEAKAWGIALDQYKLFNSYRAL